MHPIVSSNNTHGPSLSYRGSRSPVNDARLARNVWLNRPGRHPRHIPHIPKSFESMVQINYDRHLRLRKNLFTPGGMHSLEWKRNLRRNQPSDTYSDETFPIVKLKEHTIFIERHNGIRDEVRKESQTYDRYVSGYDRYKPAQLVDI